MSDLSSLIGLFKRKEGKRSESSSRVEAMHGLVRREGLKRTRVDEMMK